MKGRPADAGIGLAAAGPVPRIDPAAARTPDTGLERARAWNDATGRLADLARRGKTAVLSAGQVRQLLDSIDVSSTIGLRDRAVIALMVYGLAQVSAVTAMTVGDYFTESGQAWLRLCEKGGRRREVPAHPEAEAYVDAYLEAAGIRAQQDAALFRTVRGDRMLSVRPMNRTDVLRMIKRRARAAGLPDSTCCHTFRATGIASCVEAAAARGPRGAVKHQPGASGDQRRAGASGGSSGSTPANPRPSESRVADGQSRRRTSLSS